MLYFLCLPKAGKGSRLAMHPSSQHSAPTSAAGPLLTGQGSALFTGVPALVAAN